MACAWHHGALRGHQGSYVASPLLRKVLYFFMSSVELYGTQAATTKNVYFLMKTCLTFLQYALKEMYLILVDSSYQSQIKTSLTVIKGNV